MSPQHKTPILLITPLNAGVALPVVILAMVPLHEQTVSRSRCQVAGMLSEAQLTAPASNGSALPEPPGESSNSVLYVSGAFSPVANGSVDINAH